MIGLFRPTKYGFLVFLDKPNIKTIQKEVFFALLRKDFWGKQFRQLSKKPVRLDFVEIRFERPARENTCYSYYEKDF